MISNTPYRPPSAEVYLLAAEYWHPEVDAPWLDRALLNASGDAHDGHEINIAFAEIHDGYDEQDVRCWYYLRRAAEMSS